MEGFGRDQLPVHSLIGRYIHTGEPAGNYFLFADVFNTTPVAMGWGSRPLPIGTLITGDDTVQGRILRIVEVAAYHYKMIAIPGMQVPGCYGIGAGTFLSLQNG